MVWARVRRRPGAARASWSGPATGRTSEFRYTQLLTDGTTANGWSRDRIELLDDGGCGCTSRGAGSPRRARASSGARRGVRCCGRWRSRPARRAPRRRYGSRSADRSAASACSVRSAISRSTSASAPVASMTSRSVSTPRGVEVRVAEVAADDRGLPRVGAGQGRGDQHRALALAQVVAGRLAGLGGVAEHAEDVVAQLERLAERQPVRAQSAGDSVGEPPARAAPRCSGRSIVYFAPCTGRPAGRARRSRRPSPARAGRGTGRPSARCASGRRPAGRAAAPRGRGRCR